MRPADRSELFLLIASMSEAEPRTAREIAALSGLSFACAQRILLGIAEPLVESRGAMVTNARGRKYLVNKYRLRAGALERMKGIAA